MHGTDSPTSATAALECLSATVDARDTYTAGHSRRVRLISLMIGAAMDLDDAQMSVLGAAALFHDVGKLSIPDHILLKPSRLTSLEWEIMRRHSEEGARIIESAGVGGPAVPAIRHHHEHWDGTGYPAGLAGEEIPLEARIIHVADALDSMTTSRIYRPALPVRHAVQELRDQAGRQFCPTVIEALERVLRDNGFDERDDAELAGAA